MYHLSNAWKSKKKRPIEFQFLFLQKEINIYCVYIKNQRVGAATKPSIWIIIWMLRLSKNNSLNFCLLRCNFFLKISLYKVWIMRVKIMKKKPKIGQKNYLYMRNIPYILYACFNCWWILFHTRVEILLIYDKTIGTIKQFAQN